MAAEPISVEFSSTAPGTFPKQPFPYLGLETFKYYQLNGDKEIIYTI